MSVRPREAYFSQRPGWRQGFLAVARRSEASPAPQAFGRGTAPRPRIARATVR